MRRPSPCEVARIDDDPLDLLRRCRGAGRGHASGEVLGSNTSDKELSAIARACSTTCPGPCAWRGPPSSSTRRCRRSAARPGSPAPSGRSGCISSAKRSSRALRSTHPSSVPTPLRSVEPVSVSGYRQAPREASLVGRSTSRRRGWTERRHPRRDTVAGRSGEPGAGEHPRCPASGRPCPARSGPRASPASARRATRARRAGPRPRATRCSIPSIARSRCSGSRLPNPSSRKNASSRPPPRVTISASASARARDARNVSPPDSESARVRCRPALTSTMRNESSSANRYSPSVSSSRCTLAELGERGRAPRRGATPGNGTAAGRRAADRAARRARARPRCARRGPRRRPPSRARPRRVPPPPRRAPPPQRRGLATSPPDPARHRRGPPRRSARAASSVAAAAAACAAASTPRRSIRNRTAASASTNETDVLG